MRVYLSAPGNRLEEARDAMERLRAAGHTITHNWVAVIKSELAWQPFTDEEMAARGRADIEGVRDAEVLVVLVTDPSGPSTGVAVELGAAFAFSRSTILVEPHGPVGAWGRHPFRLMATARVETLDDALSLLIAPSAR
jgi:nucleoside 2-deoxyribosyltransferase